MEGNYLTSGDLALMESRRYYGGGDYYGHGHGKGMAATGIGLAAGVGGGALIGVLALAYGLNNASKARQKAAENEKEPFRRLHNNKKVTIFDSGVKTRNTAFLRPFHAS